MCRTAVAFLLALLTASAAPAQSAFTTGSSLSIVTGVEAQGAGHDDGRYLSGTLSGDARFLTLAARTPLSPGVDLGAEVSLGGTVSGPQGQPYAPGGSLTFLTEHHDRRIDGVLRMHVVQRPRATLSLVVGGGLDSSRTTRTHVVLSHYLPTLPVELEPDDPWNRDSLEFCAGADVTVAITRRVALMPTLRLHAAPYREGPDVPYLGMSSLSTQAGMGLVVRLGR